MIFFKQGMTTYCHVTLKDDLRTGSQNVSHQQQQFSPGFYQRCPSWVHLRLEITTYFRPLPNYKIAAI